MCCYIYLLHFISSKTKALNVILTLSFTIVTLYFCLFVMYRDCGAGGGFGEGERGGAYLPPPPIIKKYHF